ncbi:hypothetical protein [Colwellia maritima]|uniref:hypothetical protein n=1 Tax=Colwellia maritima TaxID=2912588 RepID=UPI003083FF71
MLLFGVAATGVSSCTNLSNPHSSVDRKKASSIKNGILAVKDNWANTHDRVWLGGEFWANPMENWCVKNGAAECVSRGGNRSIHSLTHQLADFTKNFEVSVVIQRLEENKNDGGLGIRLGARSDINEYRSNCFEQSGYDLGIKNNELVLGDKSTALSDSINDNDIKLQLIAKPA